jgi:protein-tyrosine phosphatase
MKNVYWIQHRQKPLLAIVARPRGEEWLSDDLLALKSSGIDILVSLLEPDEALNLGLGRESELAQQAGIEFISFPIADRATPENRQLFCRLISYLAEALVAGKHIGAHCRGSIGRSTVITASVLIDLGWKAADALRLIEEARGCAVPDTDAQRRWILQFARCSQS